MSNLYHPVDIGGFSSRGNIFLAPVAGYSDPAYRSLCALYGCDLAFSEMVSAEALIRDSGRTHILMERGIGEDDFAIQLFGAKPAVMAEAAEYVAKAVRPSVLDINCGCPVPKIVKTGAGSALMREPRLIGEIIKAMRDASGLPVTVKIRLGWDAGNINYLDVAKLAQDAGAAAIGLHARTRAQGYSGKADRTAFATLAEAVSIPVLASGDIFSPEDAREILESGKVAAVMFARGAMGNPFVFSQSRALLSGQAYSPPGPREKLEAARKHFLFALGFYDERRACIEFRKQACSWLKGEKNGAELRARAVQCSSAKEYEAFFQSWEGSIT